MTDIKRCTNEEIEEWLEPILQKQGIKNYDLQVLGATEKGDGYLGDINFVKVNEVENGVPAKEHNFVVKCGKKSILLREKMPVRNAFENEIFVYEEILPTFKQFQAEKAIQEPFDNYVRCYGTLLMDDMEVLALENLKEIDFVVLDRKSPMNMEHIEAVIRCYGKLHAISFALRDQKPEVFRKLSRKLFDMMKGFAELAESGPEQVYDPFQDIVDIATREKKFEIAEKARQLDLGMRTMHQLTDPDDPYAVILHGDCWNNNFMFKHENGQTFRPSQVNLLDWQLSRLASPVYDLSYFLFTNLSYDDIHRFDDINRLYYDTFSDFLRQLGSDPDILFPFEELQQQWKRFAKFGISMMPSLIRLCLSDKDEVPDLTEEVESDSKFSGFVYTVRNIDEYGKRCIPLLQLAIDKDLI